MSDTIDIAGLPKADVLVALFHCATVVAQAAPTMAGSTLTLEQAEKILQGNTFATPYTGQPHNVNYVLGRAIKIDLAGDTIDPSQYDAVHGAGSAHQAIQALRVAIQAQADR